MLIGRQKKARDIATERAFDRPGYPMIGRCVDVEVIAIGDELMEGMVLFECIVIEHDLPHKVECELMDALAQFDSVHGSTPFLENR